MANDLNRYNLAVEKGNLLVQQEKYRESIGAFKVALSEFKDRPEVYVGLGEACIGQRQYNRALDCYKLASRLSKGNIDHMSKVADLQERLGMLHEAAKTYMAIGERYFQSVDTEPAIDNWERAIRLDPNLLGAHQRLALAFHRSGNVKATVREYLALARILSMRGDNQKALQICLSAKRLDPDNNDIVAAMRLIQLGEDAFPEPEEEPDPVLNVAEPIMEDPSEGALMMDAVRQIASVFEEERGQMPSAADGVVGDPVAVAKRSAQEELAAELFREETDADYSDDGMIKLERDALIGQALDFQSRGDTPNAIICFEKAINGGLDLPGAFFLLGTLYIDNDSEVAAYQMLDKVSDNETYSAAVRQLLS